ncbi:MAG TPA: type IV pilin protein [Oxalicibacterium sp.]
MRTMKMQGFTAVELMVVLIVMAILAAIAFPSYQESVLKTKRVEGRAALMRLMQQQERYYSQHASYLAFSVASNDEAQGFRWYSGDNPQTSLYEISAQACEDKDIRDCVKLRAVPGTQNVNRNYSDLACGTLVLTSEGNKSADADHCW